MLLTILGIIISYLIGSIPTAYIFGKVVKGIDIRKFGSGNVGATNALRVLGKPFGLTVLLIDMLKGLLPVIFLADIFLLNVRGISADTLRILFGISSICGHIWTIFLRFRGGKGVATTFGVLLGLAIRIAALRPVFGLVVLTWLATFIILRIVSIASVVSGIAFPVFTIIFKQPISIILTSILLCIFIVARHRTNLKRFLQGNEPKLHLKKP